MSTAMHETVSEEKVTRARRAPGEQGGTASVVKALQILDVFRRGAPASGVSDLARMAGVPVSTAYRLLSYLIDAGFVIKDGTKYRPSEKLFELGNKVSTHGPQGLRERVAPYLGELYMMSGSTVRLAVLDGPEVVIVDKIVGLRTLPAPTAIGGRVPAVCSALGKAMLAHQPDDVVARILADGLPRMTRHSLVSPQMLQRQLVEARSTGVAYDREETVLGQVCMATPLTSRGRVVAAISLSSATHRADLKKSSHHLLATAGRINLAIG